ncbi:hypothetical protein P691DRAFT_756703 [Macrolepiota fuliginosa MF-IS2]|uniref:Uncharacterized protein n=1 Tax=Macrolepiota fuliginosa MF-IS2 TaxID=1400762 RepID=A0A9P5XKJ9_9AGAR|nr:hypothetical protein P691DRAFT_756703 [Macrolepiota fuliginosa MF-IS2]
MATLPATTTAACAAGNFTIDDASGVDPCHTPPFTYSTVPSGSPDDIARWTNQACAGCLNKPDLTRLNDQTYTALFLPPGNNFSYSISFQFEGNSIDVYLVLSNQSTTSCDFKLDDDPNPYISQSIPDAYQYQTLAFSRSGLGPQMHTLIITATGSPDTANYLNFDYANIKPNATMTAASSTNQTDPSASPVPSPSQTPNNHETVKAIAGGVVGGFITILALIIVISFYRHRRIKELESSAHPFFGTSGGNAPGRSTEAEYLMPPTIPQSSHNRSQGMQTYPTRGSGITPFPPNPNPSHPPLSEHRDHIREERQRELNRYIETVTSQMRSLKSSYVHDQRRMQNQIQQRVQDFGHGYNNNTARGHPGGHPEPNRDPPPVIRIVPGGTLDPVTGRPRGPGGPPDMPGTGEPMVDPTMLTDMRDQMRIMMDQIQYLRAQQNSPYAQGLTDEPPPGYMQVISSQYGQGQ